MPLETTKSQLLQAMPKGVQFVYSKDDPAMIARINSDSADLDRDKQFPILSISKSFCGAVSALMAADRKFGKEGVDATVSQALEAAIINNPAQAQQIREYRSRLESKGLGDITLAELLTHKSGIDENFSNWRSYRDNSQTQTLREITSREFSLGKDRGEFRYSNSGYTLLEEIINLASEKGGYEQELQQRIFDKLGMTRTGDLYQSQEALARVSMIEEYDEDSASYEEQNPLKAGNFYCANLR